MYLLVSYLLKHFVNEQLCCTVLALLFVFHTTDGHLEHTNGCETNCNITFDPICGTDDAGKTKMFSNECVLKSENCLHKTSAYNVCKPFPNYELIITPSYRFAQITSGQQTGHVRRFRKLWADGFV